MSQNKKNISKLSIYYAITLLSLIIKKSKKNIPNSSFLPALIFRLPTITSYDLTHPGSPSTSYNKYKIIKKTLHSFIHSETRTKKKYQLTRLK